MSGYVKPALPAPFGSAALWLAAALLPALPAVARDGREQPINGRNAE